MSEIKVVPCANEMCLFQADEHSKYCKHHRHINEPYDAKITASLPAQTRPPAPMPDSEFEGMATDKEYRTEANKLSPPDAFPRTKKEWRKYKRLQKRAILAQMPYREAEEWADGMVTVQQLQRTDGNGQPKLPAWQIDFCGIRFGGRVEKAPVDALADDLRRHLRKKLRHYAAQEKRALLCRFGFDQKRGMLSENPEPVEQAPRPLVRESFPIMDSEGNTLIETRAASSPVVRTPDEQVEHMVRRFLQWRLPENFTPDCGISFRATFNENTSWGPDKHKPVGTNLFDYEQAKVMVQYMLEGLPAEPVVRTQPTPLTAIGEGELDALLEVCEVFKHQPLKELPIRIRLLSKLLIEIGLRRVADVPQHVPATAEEVRAVEPICSVCNDEPQACFKSNCPPAAPVAVEPRRTPNPYAAECLVIQDCITIVEGEWRRCQKSDMQTLAFQVARDALVAHLNVSQTKRNVWADSQRTEGAGQK